MRFPPQFIDRLRQHFRLSEVIGQRVQLKRQGREFAGLCPFHNEKSPSFTVSDAKGFYHCFGCGAHGDVIGFLTEYENMPYVQAVEQLARQAGLAIPQPSAKEQQRWKQSESLYEVTEAAAKWFTLQLKLATGAHVREYIKSRGLPDEIVQEFRLGFAPGGQLLYNAMLQKGFSEDQLIKAGLYAKKEDGTGYDTFRRRLIFPIMDGSGRVIAFGGRVLEKDAKPKYLNSPETLLFNKRQQLYHMDVARRAANTAGTIVVVEGYMDVIALAAADIEHAVAPLGTSLTREQLELLWQATDEPVLCLDGDTAGIGAMYRAMELAIPHIKPGKSLRFCRLPAGEDPDSLIRHHGRQALEKMLAQAEPLADVFWNYFVTDRPLETPEQIAKAQAEAERQVKSINDPYVQDGYKNMLFSRFRELRYELSRASYTAKKTGKPRQKSENTLLKSNPLVSLNNSQSMLHGVERTKGEILALVTFFPALADELEEWLGTRDFTPECLNELRDYILDGQGELERAAILEKIDSHEDIKRVFKGLITGLPLALRQMDEHTGVADAEKLLADMQRGIERAELEKEHAQLQQELAMNASEECFARLTAIQARIQQLEREVTFFSENAV
jgi:DNA primase